MKLLILGGTAWLGRCVVELALEAGHDVTCLARGVAGQIPAGATLVVADRDQPAAFDVLCGQQFDAVVDVSRQPGQVKRAVAALAPICAHIVFVSTASVYAASDLPHQDESAPCHAPLQADVMQTMADYGAAKVACEDAVLAGFGRQRASIVRAGLIGGPGDGSDRSGYWPLRFAKAQKAGDAVLLPDATGLFCQLIDVRDLAVWLLHLATQRVAGTFNAMSETIKLEAFLQTAQTVAGFSGQTHIATDEWLATNGIQPWAGPKSFPLWIPMADHAGFGQRSVAAALAQGLNIRPLAQTLADTLQWELARSEPPTRKAGLSDGDHAQALAGLRKGL